MALYTFRAGVHDPQTHVVRMNLYRAGFDETRGTLLARYVEFWCQMQCSADWHVDQSPSTLAVSFSSPIDCVLFMISEEYSYFVPGATIRPKIEPAIAFAFYDSPNARDALRDLKACIGAAC
jgi:hypothetical protein